MLRFVLHALHYSLHPLPRQPKTVRKKARLRVPYTGSARIYGTSCLTYQGTPKNLGTPTIIKKQGLLKNSELYKNMNWKERLTALVLEGYLPGSTRTRHGVEGVGSTRSTPPQPDPAVDAALRRIHNEKTKKRKSKKGK